MSANQDLVNRFAYHPADAATGARHQEVRERLAELAQHFDGSLPPGREKSLALTHLEEAMFWANAAIARNPVSA